MGIYHGANERGGCECQVSREGKKVQLTITHESTLDAQDLYDAIHKALRTRGEFAFNFGGAYRKDIH